MDKNDSDTILRVSELSVGYKTRKAEILVASNINFELKQKQLIGLVGANGIGKSTLLRTLIKLQPQLNGKVHLNGSDLETLPLSELAKQLSIVLTEPLVSKNITVFELVALGRHPYTNWIGRLSEEDKLAVDEALKLVNLNDLSHKNCFEISDGQLQKVMIARALAQDTDIIVLDEPTTHLDMYHKAYIIKLLQKLTKDTGKTILFSSHEINLAIQLCDTMIVMGEDTVVCDQPCNLITDGVFESLFPMDLIAFDGESGSFRIKK